MHLVHEPIDLTTDASLRKLIHDALDGSGPAVRVRGIDLVSIDQPLLTGGGTADPDRVYLVRSGSIEDAGSIAAIDAVAPPGGGYGDQSKPWLTPTPGRGYQGDPDRAPEAATGAAGASPSADGSVAADGPTAAPAGGYSHGGQVIAAPSAVSPEGYSVAADARQPYVAPTVTEVSPAEAEAKLAAAGAASADQPAAEAAPKRRRKAKADSADAGDAIDTDATGISQD